MNKSLSLVIGVALALAVLLPGLLASPTGGKQTHVSLAKLVAPPRVAYTAEPLRNFDPHLELIRIGNDGRIIGQLNLETPPDSELVVARDEVAVNDLLGTVRCFKLTDSGGLKPSRTFPNRLKARIGTLGDKLAIEEEPFKGPQKMRTLEGSTTVTIPGNVLASSQGAYLISWGGEARVVAESGQVLQPLPRHYNWRGVSAGGYVTTRVGQDGTACDVLMAGHVVGRTSAGRWIGYSPSWGGYWISADKNSVVTSRKGSFSYGGIELLAIQPTRDGAVILARI